MTIDAPAKVNLTLRVLNRRSDGFHDIETLMVPLDLSDRLEVVLKDSPGVDFSCSDSSLPTDGSNLVCKAVAAFEKKIGRPVGVRIHLEKNIPHGAGLGGGSSDAAAVLKALNELLGGSFSVEELENLAASIGSDVPFFIRCVPAICRGRGERIEPVEGIRGAEILLVKPPFPVSTAWAYGAWAAAPKSNATFVPMFGSILMVNDLEAPVFSKHLQLPVLKSWLAAQPGVVAAIMSGSGSTVFAVLDGAGEDFGQAGSRGIRRDIFGVAQPDRFLMSEPDDVELMRLAGGGDERAFEQLVERHQNLVIGTVAKMLGGVEGAEDIAQQVFVRAWQSAPRYRPEAKFTTWLLTITRNLVFNESRRRRRGFFQPFENDDGSVMDIRDELGRDAAAELAELETQRAVDLAIAALPEAQRMAIVLRRFEGLPYEDIAVVLKTSVPAVKSLLFRAREDLRQRLKSFLGEG